jgi:hypothetical protein
MTEFDLVWIHHAEALPILAKVHRSIEARSAVFLLQSDADLRELLEHCNRSLGAIGRHARRRIENRLTRIAVKV